MSCWILNSLAKQEKQTCYPELEMFTHFNVIKVANPVPTPLLISLGDIVL